MISFFVLGTPVPKGSTRAFLVRGRPVVTADNKRTKPWQQAIAQVAQAAGCRLERGPIVVEATFYLPRPKHHLGARGVKPSAPLDHTTKPDADKLVRALLDALTGVAWVDDAQVVRVIASKRYGEPVGAKVALWPGAE